MPQLKRHSWWPTAWLSDDHRTPTAEEVRANGVLKNVRRSSDSLTLVVDCKDITCMATITPHFPEDTLILLRHIFLGYYGQPMAVIEDLDIELGSTFPVVK
jgi:hypothetical protein